MTGFSKVNGRETKKGAAQKGESFVRRLSGSIVSAFSSFVFFMMSLEPPVFQLLWLPFIFYASLELSNASC